MRRTLCLPTFALALMTLVSVTSLSAPAAHAKAEDPKAKVAVARELAQLIMNKEAYSNSLQQMSNAMLAQGMASGSKMPPDAAAKVSAAVEEALPFEELITWNAEIYAARFSIDELKSLIAFYKTPVGKKLSQLLPELMGEVGKKMGTILPERLPAAMKKHGLTP